MTKRDEADKVVAAGDQYKDKGGNYGVDLDLLEQAFAEATKIYKERGFMRKMGFGKAPAITTVDMAKAWMSDGHPFTCENNNEICANALKVLEAARKSGVPIFHTTTGYTGEMQWDLPKWDEKIPMHSLKLDSEWMEIDPKLKPQPEEPTGYGFKTIVPIGTIGDRVPGVIEWNLFDMDAKFADVLPLEEVVEYLEGIDNSVYNQGSTRK